MKNLFVGIVAACVVATAIVSPSFAADKKMGHAKMGATKMDKTMKCPACGMPMGMKASKAAPVAVKIKNATYYCCAGCPAGQAALKGAKGMKMHKGSAMKM